MSTLTQAGRRAAAVQVLDKLYEFDRRPVTRDRWLGGGYFAGSFAGEHVAATEFVIGALFVAWGVSVRDVVYGLAIGNLLAIASWTFVCAPIATQTRLTLYWYLRQIGGPVFTLIYNVMNAVLFCVLAGAMITVSASAVRVPLGIPAQTQWYPTDWRFVLVVLMVGAVVVSLAILGFKRLARFAALCSPWMLLMFLAGALAVLPRLGEAANVGRVDSLAKFWEMGAAQVWTGRTADGQPALITFWQVAAFAWICNLAMHLGLSDMALLRYARRWSYGLFSAFGMLLGHYLCWMLAGLMGAAAALAVSKPLPELDSGAVAYQALGWAGLLAVVIAGWTTSNPTLYRAGLALQAVTPNWPRWKVTLVAGIATTVVACSPFVFTKLLDFVGLYGLLLSPAGAVVITEHWLLPRFGVRPGWCTRQGRLLNWPALVAWAAGLGAAFALNYFSLVHLFMLVVPVFLVTMGVYAALAQAWGARRADFGEEVAGLGAGRSDAKAEVRGDLPAPPREASIAARVALVVAVAALIACLVLPALVYAQHMTGGAAGYAERLAGMQSWLLLATAVYFGACIVRVLSGSEKQAGAQ